MDSKVKFNIGVIGCGIVSGGHLSAITNSPKWHLSGIAEIDETRLKQSAERFKPDYAFNDYRQLLELNELDAVAVATHPETHAQITIDALEHKLHVLCEKPMADSIEKCKKMIASAEKNNKLLAINFNSRSAPQFRTIKRIIDTGVLGTIRVVRIVLNWSCHQWQPIARLEHFMKNGGPIIDSGVHFFEAVRWFTGQEFEAIDAKGVFRPPYDNPQHVIATCKMTDETIALVEAGWLFCKRTKDEGRIHVITVIGDDGTIDYNSWTECVRLYTREETKDIPCDCGKHFEIVYENFARSIELGELVELASGDDGLRATQAAYQALTSAKRLS